MNKVALFLYRIVASAALYGVLAGVLIFSSVYLFYAVDSDWIAPVVISKEDPRVLDAMEKLVTTQQTIGTLQLDIRKSEEGITEMQAHQAELARLSPQLAEAIEIESKANRTDGFRLATLDKRARKANSETDAALNQVRSVAREIERDLQAGLITKGDAALQRSQLAIQESTAVTDAMNETLMQNTILQKTTVGTESLATLNKKIDLRSQIATLGVSIGVARRQIEGEQAQIRQLQEALQLLKNTPAFSVLMGAQYFAFVPFENHNAIVGADVYDCALSFVVCKRVGAIEKVFSDEERAENPIFKTQLRGFVVQLAQSVEDSAKSKTLFVRLPLGF